MKDSKFGIWFITIINVIIAAAIIGSIVLMVISLIHFYDHAKGLLHAKEFKNYAEGLSNEVRNGKLTISEMQDLIKAFNKNLEGHKIILPSTNDPVAYATALSKEMNRLFHDSATQHAYIKALLTMVENKNPTLNSINSISSASSEFAASAIKLFKYVDTTKVINLVISGSTNKQEFFMVLLKGMGKWFIDSNELMFIGLLIFLPSWVAAIAASLILKVTRKTRGLNGGLGLFVWAILMPIFGFIFYPLISLSFMLRKK